MRTFNVAQHTKIISIGDCSKIEARAYFERLLEHLQGDLGLDFEEVYEVFGGKLAHLADFITEYTNACGDFTRAHII